MIDEFGPGAQLDSKLLYERQKMLRGAHIYPPGPNIVAVGLRVPENLGSVLRLADAAGSRGVIFINGDTPHDLAHIRRTARNCDTLVKWESCTQERFLQELLPTLRPLIALELTTRSISLFETSLPDKCAFVIGSERYGIPSTLLTECDCAVYIPMYGVNGSMNVTHALAIALFEWRRQYAT